MKAFYAYSWDDNDHEVTNWFKELIGSLSVDLVTAEPPSATNPLNKIKKLIETNEALIAIFTKRDQLRERNKWKAPDYVVEEAVFANSIKQPVLVFIEKGVVYKGSLREVTEFVEFHRNKLHKVAKKIIQYIENTKRDIDGKKIPLKKDPFLLKNSKYYKYNKLCKKVTVFKNGHGIITFDSIIEVLSNKFDGFECTFGLDDWSFKRIKLNSFSKLYSKDCSERFTSQTFSFYIKSPQIQYKLLPMKKGDTKQVKKVKVRIPRGTVKKGQTIHYCWGWSCPKLFPISVKELQDIPIISSLTVNPKIDKFIFQMNLEKGGPLLQGEINYEMWDIKEEVIYSNSVPLKETSLYYTLFEATAGQIQKDMKCIMKWVKSNGKS